VKKTKSGGEKDGHKVNRRSVDNRVVRLQEKRGTNKVLNSAGTSQRDATKGKYGRKKGLWVGRSHRR